MYGMNVIVDTGEVKRQIILRTGHQAPEANSNKSYTVAAW